MKVVEMLRPYWLLAERDLGSNAVSYFARRESDVAASESFRAAR
jgi:hypothetical protein